MENNSLKKDDSFLDVSSLAFIETLFKKYLEDPSCIDRSWLVYFNSINFKKEHTSEQFKRPSWKRSDWPLTPIEHLKDLDEAIPTKKSYSQSQSSLSTPSDHDTEQKVTDSIIEKYMLLELDSFSPKEGEVKKCWGLLGRDELCDH